MSYDPYQNHTHYSYNSRVDYAREVPQVRIGDPERDVTVEKLTNAFSRGYLTHEEFDTRSTQVVSARFENELTKLTSDLTASALEPEGKRKSHVRHRGPVAAYKGASHANKGWIMLGCAVLSLLWAVVPTVTVADAFPGHLGLLWPAFMVVAIVTGAVGTIVCLTRAIIHADAVT